MTSSACRPEASGRLEPRRTADGSLTLWSEQFGECFHSGAGAHAEAGQKFVAPAELERFAPGQRLRVLELCVGLGYNMAALLEAAEARGLQLEWLGLELDPRPLQLALGDAGFRALWQADTLLAMASGWLVVDELHITLVAVAPGQRRQGLGRQVLEALFEHARQQGARHATLEVAATNAAAVGLYRSLGFQDAGLRRGYYRNGDDALIQWLRLPPINDAEPGCG